MCRLNLSIVLFLALSASLALPVFAVNIYKYQDNQGNVFHGSQVPPEFVKNGYQVINEKGQVIEVVERALTAAEREAQSLAMQEKKQGEAERLRQEEEDKLLLRLYRSPDEVIRRRDSTVEELEAQVAALTGLLEGAQRRVNDMQSRVDSVKEPSSTLLKQSGDVTEERDRLQRQIDRIQAEKAETVDTAQKNIDRLRQLLNLR